MQTYTIEITKIVKVAEVYFVDAPSEDYAKLKAAELRPAHSEAETVYRLVQTIGVDCPDELPA